MRQPAPAPPYALAAPAFEFPALAAWAGRAQLGGERETALACLMAARLAASTIGIAPVPVESRTARATAARAWLAALALPATVRTAVGKLIEATAGAEQVVVARAFRSVTAVTAGDLDASARLELDDLARALEEAVASGETG